MDLERKIRERALRICAREGLPKQSKEAWTRAKLEVLAAEPNFSEEWNREFHPPRQPHQS